MDDKDAPAFVGAVWPRDIIEKYKKWHRRTQPWFYEKGVHLQLDGYGDTVSVDPQPEIIERTMGDLTSPKT